MCFHGFVARSVVEAKGALLWLPPLVAPRSIAKLAVTLC